MFSRFLVERWERLVPNTPATIGISWVEDSTGDSTMRARLTRCEAKWRVLSLRLRLRPVQHAVLLFVGLEVAEAAG
jgi:hypothetical protein